MNLPAILNFVESNPYIGKNDQRLVRMMRYNVNSSGHFVSGRRYEYFTDFWLDLKYLYYQALTCDRETKINPYLDFEGFASLAAVVRKDLKDHKDAEADLDRKIRLLEFDLRKSGLLHHPLIRGLRCRHLSLLDPQEYTIPAPEYLRLVSGVHRPLLHRLRYYAQILCDKFSKKGSVIQ